MEDYSHPKFNLAGYKITTTNKDKQSGKDIMAAWNEFRSQNLADKIEHKLNDVLYCVYFNYTNPENIDERGYDMLLGFEVNEGTTQSDPKFVTIEVPAQNYKYVVATGELPIAVINQWKEINAMDPSELPRTYGYDMDIYGKDGVSVAVSVQKLN